MKKPHPIRSGVIVLTMAGALLAMPVAAKPKRP